MCLTGMLDIIQSKMTWFWGYILLPLLCSLSLISSKFDVKSIIFSNFGQGPFPKIAGKSPDVCVFSKILNLFIWTYATTSNVIILLSIRKFSRGFYFCETSRMPSFAKIKLSLNGENSLSFTNEGKSCQSRFFYLANMSFDAVRKNFRMYSIIKYFLLQL